MDHNNTMEYRIGLEKQNKRDDQVTELILDNCRASQISGLTDDFVNLETLSLINVGLTTLKGFPKLPKLKKLELSDNRLSGGLNLLHGSPNLQHLNISGNRIKDLEALEPLKEFRSLVSLDLYNCEVTKVDDYRKKVFELIPNLQALDGFDKNQVEVNSDDENDDDEDEDEEESDIENHIARNGANGDTTADGVDESDEDRVEDEEGSDVDDYDEEEEDFDEEYDDGADEEEETGQNSSTEMAGVADAGDDGEDDDVQEILDEDVDDEEEEDDDDGADLKELQKDSIVDDSDDEDFEPTQEPDERDHEIDPEDDVEEDENADLSTCKLDTTVNNEVEAENSNEKRGKKRKFEDDGDGDEVRGETGGDE